MSEMRRPENIVGAEAVASHTADNTIVASCTSSIGLATGTHGNGALAPATNRLLVQPRPISTNTVVVNALRLRSNSSCSGAASHAQRWRLATAMANHGNETAATTQPSSRSNSFAAQPKASDNTLGHTSHHANCAFAATRCCAPRRQARL